jgi:chromosome segregation ATPase
MPDPIPQTQQMEDLTQAISTLLPAILRLEESLRSMDREAMERQKAMAEALDRIAAALENLPENQVELQKALADQKSTSATLTEALTALGQRLTADTDRRVELAKAISELMTLLQGPA